MCQRDSSFMSCPPDGYELVYAIFLTQFCVKAYAPREPRIKEPKYNPRLNEPGM